MVGPGFCAQSRRTMKLHSEGVSCVTLANLMHGKLLSSRSSTWGSCVYACFPRQQL
jgi:hypothetical protein